jgi:quercetin dioxygenase-like cupin family protein
LSVIRLTFEPGAEIPAHHHPGAVVLRVEEGAFGTTFVEGEGQITRASANGTPIAESVAAGDDLVLQAGDVLTYEGAIHTMRNAGDEPLVLLASVLLAADQPAFIFQQGTPTP